MPLPAMGAGPVRGGCPWRQGAQLAEPQVPKGGHTLPTPSPGEEQEVK